MVSPVRIRVSPLLLCRNLQENVAVHESPVINLDSLMPT